MLSSREDERRNLFVYRRALRHQGMTMLLVLLSRRRCCCSGGPVDRQRGGAQHLLELLAQQLLLLLAESGCGVEDGRAGSGRNGSVLLGRGRT